MQGSMDTMTRTESCKVRSNTRTQRKKFTTTYRSDNRNLFHYINDRHMIADTCRLLLSLPPKPNNEMAAE